MRSQSCVDDMINHLRQKSDPFEWMASPIFSSEIEELCLACSYIFLKEKSLLELKAPIKIAGNLDGQFNTLLSVFEHGGLPPQSTYLFLGNYADKLAMHLETVVVLLALKIKYPNNIFLLRGGWDGKQLRDDPEMRYYTLFQSINSCLECLPIAALINGKIVCAHGGYSLYPHHLDQIRHIKRRTHDPRVSSLPRDLFRSCPYMVKEGTEVVNHLKQHLICCGYQVERGYNVYPEQRLVIICSASCSSDPKNLFPGRLDEFGAMMSIDADLVYSFQILVPKKWLSIFEFITDAIPEIWWPSEAILTHRTTTIKRGEDLPSEKNLIHAFHTTKPSETCTSDSNSGSSTNTSKSESSPGDKPSSTKPLTKYRSIFAGFKPRERPTMPSNGSSNPTITTKSESSPKVNPSTSKAAASKNRSLSPGFMPTERQTNSNIGSTSVTFQPESSEEVRPFKIDPASLYRSKSPGVKRFLGARV